MEVKLVFADGTEIVAEKNGDCFITATKPAFPSNLKNIVITSEEGNQTVKNGCIVECASVDKRYWFAVKEANEETKDVAELKSQIASLEDAICELSEML